MPEHDHSVRQHNPRNQRLQRERYWMLATLVLIIAAWLLGYLLQGTDVGPLLPEVLPNAVHIEDQGQIYIGYNADRSEIVGYAAVGAAPGYGGPVEMLVGVSPDGTIMNVRVVEQRESPGFFRLIGSSEILSQYLGLDIDDPLQLGEDIDSVTGATVSAEGVAAGIRQTVRAIAAEGFDSQRPPDKKPIQFGFPELAILGLFGTGYVAHKLRSPGWKLRIRWATLLTGLVVVGFYYTIPFTITMAIALLSGYWPDWQSHLYWYFLIGGILFVTTVDAKNPYCSWFCPFGAFQECLAAITRAKVYRPRRLSTTLKWLQRGIALLAICLGLVLRKPGVASYEPFATLFDLRGTGIEWAFLVLVTLMSLFMLRPFCVYLCPIDPVVDFIAAGRRWGREGWKKWKKSSARP